MSGSWKIGRLAGIDIFIHWTFLILIGWIVFANVSGGSDTAEVAAALARVLAVFACIVLHELGHALAARKFGIATRDITLLPIGGLARLERMPEEPLQELWVALAGPAVNVVIAAGLAVPLLALGPVDRLQSVRPDGGDFLAYLTMVNVSLVLFNLLPAFPMDGGRVLRALLAWWHGDFVRATQTAARVGQAMAVVFGFVGLASGQPFLLFIALFVYLGAQAESYSAQMRSVFKGLPVREAMQTRFRVLAPRDTLRVAIDELLAGSQQDFPVVDNGKVVGVLLRNDLIKALSDHGSEAPVGNFVHRQCGTVSDADMLQTTFERMRSEECPCLPVMRGNDLVGVITLENVGELMLIQSALNENRARGGFDNIYRPA